MKILENKKKKKADTGGKLTIGRKGHDRVSFFPFK